MIMNKNYYRVFNTPFEYAECMNYDLEGDIMPRDIKDFPAYVVYYMGQWRVVNYDTFIRYLEAMRDEIRELAEDIDRYLDKEYDDSN